MFRRLKDKLQLAQEQIKSDLREILNQGAQESESRTLELYELEERVLMSATPVAVVAEAVDPMRAEQMATVESADSATGESTNPTVYGGTPEDSHTSGSWRIDDNAEESGERDAADTRTLEVVFIDTSVEDYQQLVDDVIGNDDPQRQLELILLNQSTDGIDRISESLAKFDGVDAVHIVSHGTAGSVKLGNVWLSTDNLGGYSGEIAQWGNALSSSADVLFYGCELAGNEEGRTLVDSVAALTGADVAASADDTGHAIFGGDWDLEYQSGRIETQLAVSDHLQSSWAHLLDVTVDATSTGTSPSFATSDTVSHSTSGNDRLMLVGISFGQTNGESVSSVTYNGTPLTLVGTHNNADASKSRVEIWSLASPDTGTHDVVVNYSGTAHKGATIGVMTFNGVDQTTALGSFAANDGDSTSLSTTVASAPGEIVFGVAALDESNNLDFSPGAGQTERWDLHRNNANGTGSTESGAASVQTSWSVTASSKWAAAGVSIKPASQSELADRAEFRVNTTTGSIQETSNEDRGSTQAVAAAPNGEYVVVWSSNDNTGGDSDGFGVWMQRFDATGNPIGGELQVNDLVTNGDQQHATVAVDGTGRGVVVWTNASSGTGVKARLFNADGSFNGSEFSVNTTGSGDQKNAAVAMDASGNFVVVWEGNGPDDSSGIHAQRFDAAGTKVGAEFTVNGTTGGNQSDPSVTMNSTGQFAVVWDDGNGVHARTYEPDATGGSGSQFNVDSGSSAGQADIGIDDAGKTVVTWRETASGRDVYRRVFGFDGTAQTGDDLVNSQSASDQTDPSISMAGDGSYIIVWEGNGFTDNDGVMYQKYNSADAKIDGETTINQTLTSSQSQVSVAMLDLNNFVTVWSGEGPGDSSGVFARQFGTGTSPPVITSNGGGATAAINVTENTTAVTTVTATDPDVPAQTLTYSINGGADASKFDIDGGSGTLTFASAPDFEAPTDSGGENVYEVTVQVSDGVGGTDTQDISVSVTNQSITSISTTGNATVGSGNAYTLNLAADEDATSWTINWGDGTIENITGNPATAVHTYNTAGLTYNILASATDSDGTYLQNELLVPTYTGGDSVFRFAPTTGAFLEEFATGEGLNDAIQAIIGPDGNLYVSGEASDNVLRYDAVDGTFIDEFVVADAGGLSGASGLTFGADGDLYVASYNTNEVLRFNGTTGAFIDTFVDTGMADPYSITFGPDGHLYIGLYTDDAVQRFDGATGAFIDTFVASGSGGLDSPEQIAFGPDGNLYVASYRTDEVLRYNGTTGAFVDEFVAAGSGGLDRTTGLTFGPDGNLYVTGEVSNNVLRYNGSTGAFIDEYVAAGSGGLATPTLLTFLPQQQVAVTEATANAAPANSVPGPQVTPLDTPLVFSSGTGNRISVSDDAGAGEIQVTLTVTNGTVTLNGNSGLTFIVGDGTADATMRFEGTIADINTALDGLMLDPTPSYAGPASLEIATVDLGLTGAAPLDSDAHITTKYPFDVDGADVIGANDATLNNGAAIVSDAERGNTLSVDGVNDYGNVPSVITDGLSQFTFSFWVKTTENGTATNYWQRPTLFGTEVSGFGNNDFAINTNAGFIGFWTGLSGSGDGDYLSTSTQINDNEWHHITVSNDGANASLFVDGAFEASLATGNGLAGPAFHIGALNNSGSPGRHHSGQFDDLRVFDRALTAQEVGDLYGLSDTDTVAITVEPATTTATDDIYNADEDAILNVAAPGVLDNDTGGGGPGSPTAGMSLNYDAGLDTNGNDIWESTLPVSGYDWDFSGSTASRTVSPTTSLPGISASYVFDGSGGGTMSDFQSFPGDPTEDSASFELWFNPTDAVGNEVLFETSGSFNSMSMTTDGSNLELTFTKHFGPTTTLTADLTSEIATNEFIQVVGVIDIDSLTPDLYLYVDGQLVTSAIDVAHTDWGFSDPSGLGQKNSLINSSNQDPFDGEIAIFRFYESALTTTDVQANYDAVAIGAGGGSLTATNPDTTGTTGLVTLNPDGSFDYDPNGQFESLGAGQSTDDTFGYTADNGTSTDTATVTITVNGVNDQPTGINLDNASVAENADGAVIGNLSTVDVDSGDSHTYTVDDIRFEVVSSQLKLKSGQSLDFEAAQAVNINVTSTDSGMLQTNQAFVISVTGVNDNAPVMTSDGGGATAAVNVAENTTAVTTVTATDDDLPAQTLSYTIGGGADAARFNIDSGSGVLTFAAAPDFEAPTDANTDNVYEVTVEASDGQGGTDTQDISVTVTAVNDNAPAVTSDGGGAAAAVNVAENTATVTTVTATDADLPGDTLTYSVIGGADQLLFSIDSSSGMLMFASAPDFESPGDANTDNVYEVTVQVSDGLGGTDTQDISVTVTARNDNSPTITSNGGGASSAVNVAENTTAVTTVTATDDDQPAQTLIYSISGGADAARFEIDGGSGALTFVTAPDFEAPTDSTTDNVYEVTVRVDDGFGGTDTQDISVTVTAVNDNTPVITSDGGGATAGVNVAENTTAVTTVTATDTDLPGDTLSYSVTGGADAGRFAINSTTGELTFATAPDFESPTDADTNNVYEVTVEASDGTLTDTQAISVTVTARNDNAPVITSDGGGATAAVNVTENATGVTTVTATDADLPGDTLTYSISGGADAARFNIDNTSGVLTFATAPDFEIPGDANTDNVYSVQVQVSDGSLTETQDVSVTVTPENDNTPVIDPGQSFNISETASNGTSLGTVTAIDADAGATFNDWTITDGNTGGAFAINSSTGELIVADNSNLDFESTSGYVLSVRVSDGTNTSAVETVAVTVLDENDAPVITSSAFSVVAEGQTAATTVTATDEDVPADTITYAISGGADQARFTINSSTGELSFNSAPDFDAPADADMDNVYEVEVTATDGNGGSDAQAITVMVTKVNNEPVAIDDNYAVSEGSTLTEAAASGVLSNDSDADGDALTVSLVSGPVNAASFALNADGSFVYQHNGSETTADSFAYSVSDGISSTTATVMLSINPVNDAPTVTADAYDVINVTTISIPAAGGVLSNDTDAEGDTLTATLITGATNGTVVLLADGSFVYTPDDGFSGNDWFQYVASDGADDSSPVTVSLSVVNVAPIPDSPALDSTPNPEPEPEPETVLEDQPDVETAAPEIAPSIAVDTEIHRAVEVVELVSNETPEASPATETSEQPALFIAFRTGSAPRFASSGVQASPDIRSADVDSGVEIDSLEFRTTNGLEFGDENLSFVIDSGYLEQLDAVGDEVIAETVVETWVAGSAVATGTGLSVGYIVWMVRGGYLMASLMSVLPVWQNVDPLHVLDALNNADEDDESLEEMIENSERQQDAAEQQADEEVTV